MATVRIGGSLAIPAARRSLDVDPAEVLAGAGIDPGVFEDPDNLISYAARGRLMSHCVATTRCQHFGHLVGQQGALQTLGLAGLLAKYSSDAGRALRSLANGAVAFMLNIVRTLCGPYWKPVEVRFFHRKPEDIGPFQQSFRAPLRFDAEQNALVFSAAWLQRSLPSDEPLLNRLLQKQIDAIEARHRGDLPGQVRSVLRTALLTGHARADHVAALFSMHRRTLNRRLSAFGTSFHVLVDEGRFEIARQMLEDSAMDVRQIALALGYADASAFTRAFGRWSGTTPARWRAKRGSAA